MNTKTEYEILILYKQLKKIMEKIMTSQEYLTQKISETEVIFTELSGKIDNLLIEKNALAEQLATLQEQYNNGAISSEQIDQIVDPFKQQIADKNNEL